MTLTTLPNFPTKDYCSIVMIHFPGSRDRVSMAGTTLDTLKNCGFLYELLVAFNVEEWTDVAVASYEALLARYRSGEISTLLLNSANLNYQARNQLFRSATGNYIAIIDDDMKFEAGWLKDCIVCIEHFGNPPVVATPICVRQQDIPRYNVGIVDGYRENWRAGSNAMVMKRTTFELLGFFGYGWRSGSDYHGRIYRNGCRIMVLPKNKAIHLGGSNPMGRKFIKGKPTIRRISNGEKIILYGGPREE